MPTDTTPRRRKPADQPATEPDLVDLIVEYVATHQPDLHPRLESLKADIRAEFGGQRWYVAARPETDRQQRVSQILSLFNGRNATEVARTLRIGRATVYRVIKQPGRGPRTVVHAQAGLLRLEHEPDPADEASPAADPSTAATAAVVSVLPIGETAETLLSGDGVLPE